MTTSQRIMMRSARDLLSIVDDTFNKFVDKTDKPDCFTAVYVNTVLQYFT